MLLLPAEDVNRVLFLVVASRVAQSAQLKLNLLLGEGCDLGRNFEGGRTHFNSAWVCELEGDNFPLVVDAETAYIYRFHVVQLDHLGAISEVHH